MLESSLGAPLFYALLSFVVLSAGRSLKALWPTFPKAGLPLASLALAMFLSFVDAKLGGMGWADAALHALAGLMSGAAASGGHHAIKSALLGLGLPEDLVAKIMGRLGDLVPEAGDQ